MFALSVDPCAYGQQPEPAPAESERRDDTAGKSATELAKELQNPIADLISFPFYYNAVHPSRTGPSWQLRSQLTFIF